ncbi:aldo/keto reductase [Cognatishimia sp. SS12]|uniref:aldo/keto reductase n=1 Tax=Cognatishimia sp. SS12 TaxID=2979465 RepID=UPI00233156DE|nr:aldo/keto reductase [Cognatishimia sp. SS12]MDC0739381.1 aldo/keto reductase [Cognatishimia sp. SS12]
MNMTTTSIQIPKNTLVAPEFQIPALSLGSWNTYDRMDFHEAVSMVQKALASGVNMFDIGVYGQRTQKIPTSDIIFSAIVRAAKLRREDYILSEKLWLEGFDDDQGFRPQLERALFRVGTDHADIVVLGDVRDNQIEMRDLVLAVADLKSRGLIRAWGVNNWSASNIAALFDIAAAENVDPPAMAQLKYSPARRAIVDGAPFKALFERGLKLQASDVMEGGVLVKDAPSDRMIGQDPGGIREKIAASAKTLRRIADEFGTTPAQLCIAFTMTHDHIVNTLFGASKAAHLAEALRAVELVDRIGKAKLRGALEPLWADQGVVDPKGP